MYSKAKMEKLTEIAEDYAYFGDGSFEKPKIKFYFTKPCPRLKIKTAATLPDFGSRPAF